MAKNHIPQGLGVRIPPEPPIYERIMNNKQKTNISKICILFIIWLSILVVYCNSTFGDTIIVRWTPPTHNEDGSVLTDLGGHKVFYGTEPGTYTYVTNAGMKIETNLVGLDSNTTYYISIKSFTTNDIESDFSVEIISLPLSSYDNKFPSPARNLRYVIGN